MPPHLVLGIFVVAVLDIWAVLLIFILVMGGIYTGIFTPTEGAGIGCVGTFLIAITRGAAKVAHGGSAQRTRLPQGVNRQRARHRRPTATRPFGRPVGARE